MTAQANVPAGSIKKFDWKDTNILLWALPLLGYLIAVCFDIGYLSYFGVPASFSEINLYSVGRGALFLVFIVTVIGFSIYTIYLTQKKASANWAQLFDTNIFFISIFVYLFLLSLANTFYFYLAATLIHRVIDYLFPGNDYFENLIRNTWLDSTPRQPQTQSSSSYLVNILASWLVIMAVFGFANLIIDSGRATASISHLEMSAEEKQKNGFETILIPRNDNRFIKVTYAKNTGIVSPEIEVLTLSDTGLKFKSLSRPPKLITLRAHEQNLKNEEQSVIFWKYIIESVRGY